MKNRPEAGWKLEPRYCISSSQEFARMFEHSRIYISGSFTTA